MTGALLALWVLFVRVLLCVLWGEKGENVAFEPLFQGARV